MTLCENDSGGARAASALGGPPRSTRPTAALPASIPIVFRLERAFDLDADVVGLVLAQLGELDADLGEPVGRGSGRL